MFDMCHTQSEVDPVLKKSLQELKERERAVYLERMNIPDLDYVFSLMNLSKLNYPNRLCCKCHLHLNAERERDGCGMASSSV